MICRMKYRNHVPYGWIAIEFCNAEFFGDEEECRRMNSKLNDIVFEKYNANIGKVNAVEDELECLKKEIEQLQREMNENSFFFGLFLNSDGRRCSNRLQTCMDRKDQLEVQLKESRSDLFYSTPEKIRRTTNFLISEGFKFQDKVSSGGECRTYEEVWVLE